MGEMDGEGFHRYKSEDCSGNIKVEVQTVVPGEDDREVDNNSVQNNDLQVFIKTEHISDEESFASNANPLHNTVNGLALDKRFIPFDDGEANNVGEDENCVFGNISSCDMVDVKTEENLPDESTADGDTVAVKLEPPLMSLEGWSLKKDNQDEAAYINAADETADNYIGDKYTVNKCEDAGVVDTKVDYAYTLNDNIERGMVTNLEYTHDANDAEDADDEEGYSVTDADHEAAESSVEDVLSDKAENDVYNNMEDECTENVDEVRDGSVEGGFMVNNGTYEDGIYSMEMVFSPSSTEGYSCDDEDDNDDGNADDVQSSDVPVDLNNHQNDPVDKQDANIIDDSNVASQRGVVCIVCSKVLTTQDMLLSHLFEHGKRRKKCVVCDKTFSKVNVLRSHVLTHLSEERPTCYLCNKTFSSRVHLKRHKKCHLNVRPFVCKVCGNSYKRADALKQHMYRHEKKFVCHICGKNLSEAKSLKKHLMIHNGDRPHKCNYCDKAFTCMGALNKHLRTHTGDMPYFCSECGKGFVELHNLRVHIQSHTGVKPFKCDVCGKLFTRTDTLKKHQLIHTGEKPYKCRICGEDFRRTEYLQRHMVTHTGEMPYRCKVCGKGFAWSAGYKIHCETHTNGESANSDEKQYICEHCGKSFAKKMYLYHHRRRHNPVLPYKCADCEKSFYAPSQLKRHLVVHKKTKVKNKFKNKTKRK